MEVWKGSFVSKTGELHTCLPICHPNDLCKTLDSSQPKRLIARGSVMCSTRGLNTVKQGALNSYLALNSVESLVLHFVGAISQLVSCPIRRTLDRTFLLKLNQEVLCDMVGLGSKGLTFVQDCFHLLKAAASLLSYVHVSTVYLAVEAGFACH